MLSEGKSFIIKVDNILRDQQTIKVIRYGV